MKIFEYANIVEECENVGKNTSKFNKTPCVLVSNFAMSSERKDVMSFLEKDYSVCEELEYELECARMR